VWDADAMVRVGERVLQESVGHDGAGIGETKQGVIGEHGAKAQQASNEEGLWETSNASPCLLIWELENSLRLKKPTLSANMEA